MSPTFKTLFDRDKLAFCSTIVSFSTTEALTVEFYRMPTIRVMLLKYTTYTVCTCITYDPGIKIKVKQFKYGCIC